MLIWIVEKRESGRSLEEFLQRRIMLARPAYLRQLLRSGKVRCNGMTARPEDLVAEGDEIELPASNKLMTLLKSGQLCSDILYESREILIVNKPSGLATHAGKGHGRDNLTLRVEQIMRLRGENFRIAPTHRLDLETSGPVIYGKGKKAIGELGKLFQEKKIQKTYLALAATGIETNKLLSAPISSKGKIRTARTHIRPLETHGNLSLYKLEPETGRQHQIRRHMANAGHPIAGDRRYRGPLLPGLDRLFLHCWTLAFHDPFSEQNVKIEALLPTSLMRPLSDQGFTFGQNQSSSGV